MPGADNLEPTNPKNHLALQDTVTGFLLAGVGNVDLRRKTNYLIVDSSMVIVSVQELTLDILFIFLFAVCNTLIVCKH